MARWVGLAVDPTTGGTTYDDINADEDPVAIPVPTVWVPYTDAQVDPGTSTRNRDDQGWGSRVTAAPIPDKAAPSCSLTAPALPSIVKLIWSRAMSKIGTATGTSPAAVTTPVTPIDSNPLMHLVFWLLREDQLDIVTGVAVDSTELKFDLTGSTVSLDGKGLYHETYNQSAFPDTLPTASYTTPAGEKEYLLRDLVAKNQNGAVQLDCLAGLSLKWDNSLVTDEKSRYCAGHNVASVGTAATKVWYPTYNKVGKALLTGTLDFGSTQPGIEEQRIASVADKYVFDASAGAINPATTPASDELARFTVPNLVQTGGGADPLKADGDQTASYQFGGYLDTSSATNLKLEFVSKAAVE